MGLEKSEDEVLFFEGGITGEFEVASDVAQLRYSFCFKFGDIHVVLGRGRSKSMGSNTPFLLSLLNLEFVENTKSITSIVLPERVALAATAALVRRIGAKIANQTT